MSNKRDNKSRPVNRTFRNFQSFVLIILLITLSYFVLQNANFERGETPPSNSGGGSGIFATRTPGNTNTSDPDPTEEPIPTPEPTPELPSFEPYAIEASLPSNMLTGTALMYNNNVVEGLELASKIDFGFPTDYTALEGVTTFRGNNFRDTAAYGTVSMTERKFSSTWTHATTSLSAPNGQIWFGNGWTGQPLIVKWPRETRANMNMYDWAKSQEELVEVVYASMDGYIYFIELTTGKKTRNDYYVGYTFKGAGTLDPRGYPILYVGSGYDSNLGTSRAFIINLLDCSIMYQFGNNDPFSNRGTLSYFDAAPLIDADTDQLIYPGESGILYIMKLNTNYNEAAGTLSIEPSDIVKWKYNSKRNSASGGGQYWLGMEASPIIWRGHIIMSDNGGCLVCLNLNTFEVAWVQDTLDDTNCTPVFELENGHPYIYTSTSFHGGWRAPMSGTAPIPIWKIDAVTGNVIWRRDYTCYTYDGVSGGVQGTLAIGKNSLSDMIFVPVARTGTIGGGKLVALDKSTGEEAWPRPIESNTYAWSSPVAIYTEDGHGYLLYCTAGGYMYLIDGLTGESIDSINLGSNIEASPAVYGNTIVVGTRGNVIYGITLT